MVGNIQNSPTSGPGTTSSSGPTSGSSGTNSSPGIQDTLVSDSLTVNPAIFDPATPALSILQFQGVLGSTTQAAQQADIASILINATQYKNLRLSGIDTASQLIQQIENLRGYYTEYQALVDNYNTNIAPIISQAATEYNNGNTFGDPALVDTTGPNNFTTYSTTTGSSDLQQAYDRTQNPSAQSPDQVYSFVGGDAASTMLNLTPSDFSSNGEYQTYIQVVGKSLSEYDTHANQRNSDITTYNSDVTQYNSKTTAFNNEVDKLNALSQKLGLSTVPVLSDLPTLSQLPAWPVLPIPSPGIWSTDQNMNAIITGQSPPFGDSQYSIPTASFNAGNDTNYLLTPPVAPSFTYSIQPIDPTSFSNTYIVPLVIVILQLGQLQQNATNQLVYQSLFRLQYGQTVQGLPPQTPKPLQGTNTVVGSSVASVANDPTVLSNPNLSQILSNSLLNQLYDRLGVPSGSPLVAETDKVLNQALDLSAYSIISLAAKFLEGVSPSASPQGDAVQGAVSLALLQKTQGIVAGNETAASLYLALFQNLTLSSLSNSELAQLAESIGAALNVQLLSLSIFQLATAIGASGLLPQVLASLGSMSPDEINTLILGQINFLNLNSNPLAKVELQQLLQQQLAQEGLTASAAQQAASNALQQADNATGQKDALQAIADSLNSSLANNNISPANATAFSGNIVSLLSNPTQLQQQLSQLTQENTVQNEIRTELSNAGLDNAEIEQLIANNNFTNNQNAILAVLNKANLPNPEESLQNILSLANNPLRSTNVTTPLTPDELQSALTELLYKPFSQNAFDQGIVGDKIAEVASGFVQGPTSIANLLQLNLQAVKEALKQENLDKANQSFADFMAPKVSLVAFMNELLDPAKMLVFLDQVQYQGIVGKVAGPGAPAAFGYMPSTQSV